MTEFRKAAVIGTGMMGPGIAAVLALGGVEAVIVSRSRESAAIGLTKAGTQIALLKENGLADEDQANWALEHLQCSCSPETAFRDADILIESAPEEMAFKQELFARLETQVRPDTVLASNTSGLSITSIAERCTRPERILTTHFWNPPHLMPLVEVVVGERTDPSVAESVYNLLLKCGKTPVRVHRDRPGQLGNRLQFALLREAIHIVAEGIATAEDVDLAAKSGFGLRLPAYGIFEHQDIVGLDMGQSIANYVMPDLYREPQPPALLAKKVSEGHLGAKAGAGFYDWSVKSPDEVRARRDAFVLSVLRARKQKAAK